MRAKVRVQGRQWYDSSREKVGVSPGSLHQHIPVAWTCTQNLISKEHKTVTYLITEPMLRSRRKSKSQGVVAQKKQVT